MQFKFCLTCNVGRDEYWKLVAILWLLLPKDILEFEVNTNIVRAIEGLKDKIF